MRPICLHHQRNKRRSRAAKGRRSGPLTAASRLPKKSKMGKGRPVPAGLVAQPGDLADGFLRHHIGQQGEAASAIQLSKVTRLHCLGGVSVERDSGTAGTNTPIS